MDRDTSDRLLGFFVSFGVTFLGMMLVLGTVCFASYSRSRESGGEEPRLTQTRPDTYLPSEEDRITLLVAGTEEKGMEPDTYLLLGFFPEKGRIALCVLSPATYLEYGGQGSTIGRLWQQGGLPYAKKGLAQYLDIPIQRYALVETEDLDSLITYGGMMDYDLAVDLKDSLHGRRIDMPRGRYRLDGRRAMDIINYPAYKGGERERSDRAALLISQLITRSLPLFLGEEGSQLQELALSLLDTDLSVPDCLRRSAALEFLARLELPATTTVFLEGSLSKNYTVYHLTEGCKDRLYEVYRDPAQPDRRGTAPDAPIPEEPVPVQEPVSGADKPRWSALDSGWPPIQEQAEDPR